MASDGDGHYNAYTYGAAAMTKLKLTAVGTSTGLVIPKEMLAHMNVAKGDVLYAVEGPDGSYRLTPYDPAFAARMDKAEDIIRRYRNTLRVLAQ
jgi:putative addiction module antidote